MPTNMLFTQLEEKSYSEKISHLTFKTHHSRLLGYESAHNSSLNYSFSPFKGTKTWANFSLLTKRTSSLTIQDPSWQQILPLSLGIKQSFKPFKSLTTYVGAGVIYKYLAPDRSLPYHANQSPKWEIEASANTGFRYRFNSQYYVMGFIDYAAQKSNALNKGINIQNDLNKEGFQFGFGMGLNF